MYVKHLSCLVRQTHKSKCISQLVISPFLKVKLCHNDLQHWTTYNAWSQLLLVLSNSRTAWYVLYDILVYPASSFSPSTLSTSYRVSLVQLIYTHSSWGESESEYHWWLTTSTKMCVILLATWFKLLIRFWNRNRRRRSHSRRFALRCAADEHPSLKRVSSHAEEDQQWKLLTFIPSGLLGNNFSNFFNKLPGKLDRRGSARRQDIRQVKGKSYEEEKKDSSSLFTVHLWKTTRQDIQASEWTSLTLHFWFLPSQLSFFIGYRRFFFFKNFSMQLSP